MSVQLLVRCDSPGCEQFRLAPVGQPPADWLSVNGQATFCSFTCMALYAAQVASEHEKPAANGTEPDGEPEKAEVDASSPA